MTPGKAPVALSPSTARLVLRTFILSGEGTREWIPQLKRRQREISDARGESLEYGGLLATLTRLYF